MQSPARRSTVAGSGISGPEDLADEPACLSSSRWGRWRRCWQGLLPDSGVRGKQFELICRWYLRTDPLYRRELKRVWLWDEWPGRWGADAGIDLVADARDGGLWAIQAKAYDPRYRIKKSDVDTFLSESARPEFSFRLLIATTNEIGATAKRTLEAQEKPGHLLFLADLERAAVEWPTS